MPKKEDNATESATTDADKVLAWAAAHKGIASLIGFVALVVVVVAGIALVQSYMDYSDNIDQRVTEQEQKDAAKADDPYASIRGEDGFVSEEDFGGDWPLTVSAGVVQCDTEQKGGIDLEIVTFDDLDGKTYALNGTAQSHADVADIDPIWSDDPDVDGLKVDISPLIDAGRALC